MDAYPTAGSLEKSIYVSSYGAELVQSGMLAYAAALQSGHRTGLRCGRTPGIKRRRACGIRACSSGLLLPDELVRHIRNRIFKRNTSRKDRCNHESEKNIFKSKMLYSISFGRTVPRNVWKNLHPGRDAGENALAGWKKPSGNRDALAERGICMEY